MTGAVRPFVRNRDRGGGRGPCPRTRHRYKVTDSNLDTVTERSANDTEIHHAQQGRRATVLCGRSWDGRRLSIARAGRGVGNGRTRTSPGRKETSPPEPPLHMVRTRSAVRGVERGRRAGALRIKQRRRRMANCIGWWSACCRGWPPEERSRSRSKLVRLHNSVITVWMTECNENEAVEWDVSRSSIPQSSTGGPSIGRQWQGCV